MPGEIRAVERSQRRDGVNYYVKKDTFEQVVRERSDNRLLIISKTGSGSVYFLQLLKSQTKLQDMKVRKEIWDATTELADFAVVVMGNALYIIGGRDTAFNEYVATVSRFDPFRNAWRKLAPMKTARAHHSAMVIGDRLHIVGGVVHGSKQTVSCEVYDPVTDTWTDGQPLPAPRSHMASCKVGREVFVSGGKFAGSSCNNIWVYNGFKWAVLDRHYPIELPFNVDRHSSIGTDDSLLFIGGLRSAVAPDDDDENLSPIPPLPPNPLLSARVDAFQLHVQIANESLAGSAISPWDRMLPEMPHRRHSADVLKLGNRLVVVGGTGIDGKEVRQIDVYNPDKQTWSELLVIEHEVTSDLKRVHGAVLDYGKQVDRAHTCDLSCHWPLW